MKLKNKILVTGSGGYIGPVLCRLLLSKGYQVVGLDSNYFNDCKFFKSDLKIRQIAKDLRDVDIKDLSGINTIMHLGGISNDPMGEINSKLTYDINYKATVRLAKLAKKAGVERFIFSSSCSMYGIADDGVPLTEKAPLNPVTAYAISKVKAEKALSSLATNNFSPVFLRNSTAYGVSPKLRVDLVLNNLVGWAFTTGKIKIMSDGSPWRPLAHIEDIAMAFVAALEASRSLVHNEAFNVGQNSENYRIRDIAETVRKVVHGSSVEYTGEHGADSRTYKVNFDKIKKLKGFKPKWTLKLGAMEIYKAFKKHKLTFKDFQGHRYIRIKHIIRLLNANKIDSNFFWVKRNNSK